MVRASEELLFSGFKFQFQKIKIVEKEDGDGTQKRECNATGLYT